MSTERDARSRQAKGMLQRELGKRIVQARKRRGWNQSALARRLEVPRERLGKWERGLNAPSLEDLAAVSEVLEVPLAELGIGRPPRKPISSGELAGAGALTRTDRQSSVPEGSVLIKAAR